MTTRNEFQKTEIGRIPSEWDVGAVDEYCTVVDCRHVTAEFVMSGIPVASIGEVQSRYVNLSSAKQTTDEFYQHLIGGGRKPQAGDLIFSRNATVGEVAQVTESHPPFAMGQDVCLIRKKGKEHSSDYLQSVIRSNIVTNQLENMMVGSTFRRVNVRQIKSLIVPVPKPKEQRAIAEALSDVDALINALDALITKKRHIKQGTMQQLLTGKKRLPGFSGDWSRHELGDIGTFRAGDGFPTRFQEQQNGKCPFFKVGDLSRLGNESEMVNAVHFISESVKNKINAKPFAAGTIVFAKIGAAVHLERKRLLVGPSCIDNNLMGYIVNPERMNSKFAYFGFKTISLGDYANTSAVPSLNSTDLKKIEIRLPSKSEQTAIAEVLSDMDAEITALEQKRDKTKLIKQGMMQELLTGKTRLI